MKISVITPSIRPTGLPMVRDCLLKQTFKDFEWIIVGPVDVFALASGYTSFVKDFDVIPCLEPPKNEGDYYGLNKAWNAGLKRAQGKLFVSITDWIWFQPDLLETHWLYYEKDPKACIGAVGNQYQEVLNGKPEILVWKDPRVRTDLGSFYEIAPLDLEFCVASLPMQGIKEVGGFDERFDQYSAISEKELCYRLDKLGYTFWLDQSLEYRAFQHPRLNEDWDKHYEAGTKYFAECLHEIKNGTRTMLDYLM